MQCVLGLRLDYLNLIFNNSVKKLYYSLTHSEKSPPIRELSEMIELLGDIKVPSSKTGEGLMVKLDHVCLDNQSHYSMHNSVFLIIHFALNTNLW